MDRPIIIGISGGSGSGKSCFVRSLDELFDKDQISIVSMDNYYFPRETQKVDDEGKRNFDLPDSIDSKSFYKDLQSLIHGKPVEKEEYVFNNPNKTAAKLNFNPAPVIIVEGLFIFHYKKIANLLDYKVFMNAADDLKVIRRIKRDGLERNYPLDDVLYRYDKHVSPAYRAYIEPYIEDADIIINNFESYTKGLNIVSGFISSLLK